jgi:hypothetical protein
MPTMSTMIQPETWKAVGDYSSKAWAALGPLIGVFVGAYLTGRRQRRDWLADSKKEEYRELVGILSEGLSMYIQQYAVQTIRSGEDEGRLHEMLGRILVVMRSRLFIKKIVNSLNVAKRWNDLTRSFEDNHDSDTFSRGVGKLLDDILEAAMKDMAG